METHHDRVTRKENEGKRLKRVGLSMWIVTPGMRFEQRWSNERFIRGRVSYEFLKSEVDGLGILIDRDGIVFGGFLQ